MMEQGARAQQRAPRSQVCADCAGLSAVERREAPGPCAKGSRVSPDARRVSPNPPKGASPAPWRLPALHSLFGGTEKGTTAYPAPPRIRAAERWLF